MDVSECGRGSSGCSGREGVGVYVGVRECMWVDVRTSVNMNMDVSASMCVNTNALL